MSVETTDYDHRRCFDSKIQPVREAPQQRPPLVAVYNGEQLRVMLNALQGNTYGIKKLSSQACRFALIPARGGIDILLSRLGKDYGPLQGKLRSMRFLTASQGWAFCASCS